MRFLQTGGGLSGADLGSRPDSFSIRGSPGRQCLFPVKDEDGRQRSPLRPLSRRKTTANKTTCMFLNVTPLGTSNCKGGRVKVSGRGQWTLSITNKRSHCRTEGPVSDEPPGLS